MHSQAKPYRLIGTLIFARGVEVEFWSNGPHVKTEVTTRRNGFTRRHATRATLDALVRLYGLPTWAEVAGTT
jgi:hypothetical protein